MNTDKKREPEDVPEPEKDVLLVMLIDMVEKIKIEDGPPKIDVTLQVGGLLVTGRICDKDEFWKSHPFSNVFHEKFGELEAKEKEEAKAAGKPVEDQPEPPRRYIHLSDAKFFVPGHQPIPTTGPGIYWRGKLSSVDGFTFGVLREGHPPESE